MRSLRFHTLLVAALFFASPFALASSKYNPSSGGGGGAVNQVHAGTGVTVTGTTADPIVNATGSGGGISSVSADSGCVTVATVSGAATVTSTACLSADFSNVTSPSGARTALGLGTAATQNVAAFLQPSNNLSEIGSPSTARTNLGLGTLSTQSGTFSGTSSGTNTGDQTITLTGPVTGSGTGSITTTIGAAQITLANQANLAAKSVIGNSAGSAATPTALAGTAIQTIITSDTCTTQTVSGSAVQNVTFTTAGSGSINGDVDGGYRIRGKFVHNGASTLAMQPNGTSTFQASRGVYSTNSSAAGIGAAANLAMSIDTSADQLVECHFVSHTGIERFFWCSTYELTGNYFVQISGAWTDTSTNLTSIVMHGNIASGIGIGSTFTVCQDQ